MTELKKEELLGILGIRFAGVCSRKEARAYQQIRAIITKFDEECVRSYKTGYKAGLIQKPEVTEEWIEKMAEDTAGDYPDVAFPNLITIFKKLLKEAGVHVS